MGPFVRCAVVVVVLLVSGGCGDAAAPASPAPQVPVVPPRPPGPVPPGPNVPPGPSVPSVPPEAPTSRREGNLIVEWPTTHRPMPNGRLRSHVAGPMNARAVRHWAGPTRVPEWMALHRGALELSLLDETADGYFAVYREPYDATPTGCALSGPRVDLNCEVVVAFFAPDRSERWTVRLNDFFSRPDHLELQDVRYAGGVLYFNEACAAYARDAGGRCSALIAIDPTTRRIHFRTRPLVSNGEIVVLDQHVLTSYGFSGEQDRLSLVARANGRVVARMDLPAKAERVTVVSTSATSPMNAVLDVMLYERGTPWRVNVEGIDQPTPRFVPVGEPPAQLPSRMPVLRMGMRDPAPTRPPPTPR